MSGRKPMASSETRIEALQLQSSAYGVAIPIVGGVTRIPGNLIYYADFKSIPYSQSQGGKGGVKTTQTTYSYQASIIMALCHGQVAGVPRIWKGKTLYGNGTAGTVSSASETYAVPGGGGTYTVAHAAAFGAHKSVLCDVFDAVFSDDFTGTLAEGVDYTQSNGVYSFPAGSRAAGKTVTIAYTYYSVAPGTPALSQLGATLLPGSMAQSAPSWVTTLHPSEALAYAGIAAISAQAYSLGPGAQVDNHNFEVIGPGAYSLGTTVPDCDPAEFAVRVLQDARYGARIPAQFVGDIADWSAYCRANNLLVSPAITAQIAAAEALQLAAKITNTGLVWSGGKLKFVPYGDEAATGNGVTWTPNTTPVYNLTSDVFVVHGTEPPVRITRKPGSQAYNHIRVQFRNRGNSYAAEVAEAKDQADIEINGLRSAEIVNADWICDGQIARNVAQLMLQRSLYIGSVYQFTLPFLNFDMLEPMDLVTLTEPSQGLSNFAVRIVTVEEDGEEIKFTAEIFAQGVASTPLYTTQIGAGFGHDFNVAPGDAEPPVIFEAPAALTETGLEVYVAAVGLGAHWGGCNVWVSLDGLNYRLASTIHGGSRYGALTANAGASYGMDVEILAGELGSGSADDALALTVLCYVGGAAEEYFAYEIANLTAPLAYTLGGTVARGAYGTQAAAHSTGDAFVRVDESIGKSGPLDLGYVGRTIHIKLTSFNVYGGAEQALSSVADYTYTITGRQAALAAAAMSGNLIDPSWWRPGAAWEWNLNETPAGENSIVWGTGPKGQPQALWRAIAAGTPGADKDGGWDIGTLATTPRQAFVVDPARTYRFACAIRRTVGTAWSYFGPRWYTVCDLNTGTLATNPYFASWTQPADGRWYLYVGYIYPAGSTGLTNAGAGIYDMETGELVQSGANYCWPADATECSTRAYQYYATTGATQYFAPPVVEVMDGYEAGRITYIGEAQVDTVNVAQSAITEGTTLLAATTTGSTGSPGASTTVILMAGPTLDVGDDELDFDVSGVADVEFWSQAAIGRVEVFLKWQAGFGNPYTEIGTRRKFATPVDVYTNNTKVSMDKTEAAFVPGPGSKDYFLECRITWIDAAGSTKQCGKAFTADALFKWVRRKR